MDAAASVLSGALSRAVGQTVAGSPYTISKGTLAANSNYTLLFTGSNLTITPHDLHVAANSQTKVYGAADPMLSYAATAADLQYSDTAASVLSGSLSRAVGQTVAGSPYTISKGTLAANSNYTLLFTGSNLAITKAPLTVAADDKAMLINGTVPALTATLTGFQYSETLAASGVAGAAACTTAQAKQSVRSTSSARSARLRRSTPSFGPFMKGTSRSPIASTATFSRLTTRGTLGCWRASSNWGRRSRRSS